MRNIRSCEKEWRLLFLLWKGILVSILRLQPNTSFGKLSLCLLGSKSRKELHDFSFREKRATELLLNCYLSTNSYQHLKWLTRTCMPCQNKTNHHKWNLSIRRQKSWWCLQTSKSVHGMLLFIVREWYEGFHWNSFSMKTISMTGEAAVKFFHLLHSSR